MSNESKAAVIRRYIRQYPDVGPTDLAAKIEKEVSGLKVKSQEVSKFKHKMKANAPPAAAAKVVAAPAQAKPDDGLATKVKLLKQAADAVGGPEEAKKLLDLLK